jgi:hypothetical protein
MVFARIARVNTTGICSRGSDAGRMGDPGREPWIHKMYVGIQRAGAWTNSPRSQAKFSRTYVRIWP